MGRSRRVECPALRSWLLVLIVVGVLFETSWSMGYQSHSAGKLTPVSNDKVVDDVDLSEGSGAPDDLSKAALAGMSKVETSTEEGSSNGDTSDDDDTSDSTFDDIDDSTNAVTADEPISTGSNIQSKCPASCNNRGSCMIVYPGAAQQSPYYACMCNKGYRGRGCEIDDLRTESGESGGERPTSDMPSYDAAPKAPPEQWPWPTEKKSNYTHHDSKFDPVPSHLVSNMPTYTKDNRKDAKKIETSSGEAATIEFSDDNFQCVHRCSGHGKCQRFTQGHVADSKYWYCECEKEWSGVDCSVRHILGKDFSPMSPKYKAPVQCSQHQCKHGGIVTMGRNGCTCRCPNDWTGRQCEVCNKRCHNGGVTDTESCTCVCKNGFSGELCDTCNIKCKEGAMFDPTNCACKCKLDNVYCNVTAGVSPHASFEWAGSAGGQAGGRVSIASMPMVDPNLWGDDGFSIMAKVSVSPGDGFSKCVLADQGANGIRLCLQNDVWSLDTPSYPTGALPEVPLSGAHILAFTYGAGTLRMFVDGHFKTKAQWSPPSGHHELGANVAHIGYDEEHATSTDWPGTISHVSVYHGALSAPAVLLLSQNLATNTTNDIVGDVTIPEEAPVNKPSLELLQIESDGSDGEGEEDNSGKINIAEVNGGKCPFAHNGTCACSIYGFDEQCEDHSKCGLECLHGGQLKDGKCECECTPPWTGKQCEACGRVCQHGGTLNGESCTCDCPNPWSGPDCSQCSPFCEHNGIANDLERQAKLGSCSCNCRPPWTGIQCEVCSAYCGNGGTLDHDTCTCKCEWPWKGKECDECSLNCYHGSYLDEASCRCEKCPEPWTGRACNRCSLKCNQATLDPYKCKCRCQYPWQGADCDVCTLTQDMCQNGGVLDAKACECKCPPQWTGRLCDRCSLDCYNNSTFNMDECKCDCPSGFGGLQCENCTRECFNGGMPNHNCTCACPGGWGGESCLDCQRECRNGGTLDAKTCKCSCPTPWHGSSCSVCEAKCMNGRLNRDKCACECHNSWSGSSCDQCNVQCENGGKLEKRACKCNCHTSGGFWKGDRCETCDFDFCFNGGWFNPQMCFCHCIYPWGGKKCDQCKLECKNGGIIPYDQKDCKCVCPSHWTGVDCSIRVPALIPKQPQPVQDWPPEQVFMCGKSYACPYPTQGERRIHPAKESTSSEGAKGAPSPYSSKCAGGKKCGVGWFCWAGLPRPWKRATRVGPSEGDDSSGVSVCPNECSHHGRCYNGTCLCVPSYSGDDCSQQCPEWTQKPVPIKTEYFGNVNITGQPYFEPQSTSDEKLSRADGKAGLMSMDELTPAQRKRVNIRRGKHVKRLRSALAAGLGTIRVNDADGEVNGDGSNTETGLESMLAMHMEAVGANCNRMCKGACSGDDGDDPVHCQRSCTRTCHVANAHYSHTSATGDMW